MVLVWLGNLLNGQSTMPPPEADPFVGQWRANADKSRPRLTKVERSYERTIRREGDELIFASSGGASTAAVRDFRIRCDGRFYPLPAGPSLSCVYVSTDRVEGETKDALKGSSFWTREVSPDGRELMISEYRDKARKKVRSVIVLDRVK